jgi:hypothetical protein
MKRSFLLPALLLLVLLLPGLTVSQDAAKRDSLKTTHKPRRSLLLQHELMRGRAELASEQARLLMEQGKMRMEAAHLQAEIAPHLYELQAEALAHVGPAVEQAMAQAAPALAQVMEGIAWPEINAAVQDASRELARLAPLMDMPPMPPFPPIPPIPPMPPLPSGIIAPFIDGDLDWDFESGAYAEQLSGDEQIQLQALAALWDRDENAALPEIKRLAREHENWAMRASAVRLLANSESAESLAILDEVVSKDADRRVRKAAVQALANRSEPEARDILKRLLQK